MFDEQNSGKHKFFKALMTIEFKLVVVTMNIKNRYLDRRMFGITQSRLITKNQITF